MIPKSMQLNAGREASETAAEARSWLDLDRVRLYSAVMLVLVGILLLAWAWESRGFTATHVARPGADFSVFWGASYLALHEGPLQAYDVGRLTAVIAEYGTLESGSSLVLPWLYPPTFLLAVMPLSLLPLAFSYLAFLVATGYVYLRAVGLVLGAGSIWQRGAWLPVVASPATIIAAVMGQNALLTAGLAALAVHWLGKRPVLAGIALGLLAIKPQLAALFPLVLILTRQWKAFAAAAVTALLFAAISVAVCGWDTVPAFLDNMHWVRNRYLEDGVAGWYGMPTMISAARLAGASATTAYLLHAVFALAAVGLLAYVWLRSEDSGLRAAALAVATLLAIPYLRDYELTWLGIAIAGVVGDGLRHGLSGGERVVLLLAWLLPLFEHANPLFKLPQLGPLLLIAMMLLIVRRVAVRVAGDRHARR